MLVWKSSSSPSFIAEPRLIGLPSEKKRCQEPFLRSWQPAHRDESAAPDHPLGRLRRRGPPRRPHRTAGIKLLIRWLGAPEQAELREAFRDCLVDVKLPEQLADTDIPKDIQRLEEVDAMPAERLKQWTEEWSRQGEATGWVEGRAERRNEGRGAERGEFLRRLMIHKYGPLCEAHRWRLDEATPEQLLEWGERILFAATPEEMFGEE